MIDTEKAKKFGADKIALLGLFALSLLIAQVMVASKTGLVLSKPIILPYSGLAICLPDKNGWKTQENWRYEQNNFTLSSIYRPGITSVSANIKCTYVLAANRDSEDKWITQQSNEYDARVSKSGVRKSNGLNFHWVYLTDNENLAFMLIATARLTEGRWLEIEILDTTVESDMALKVFEEIAANLKFEQNQLLAAGQNIVAKLKQNGVDNFVDTGSLLEFFTLKNAADENIGFTMEHTNLNQNSNMEMAGFLYTKSPAGREEASMFQCDKNISRFSWSSQTTIRRNVFNTIELNLIQNDLLTVTGLFLDGSERQYVLNSAAIPYSLIDILFKQMLTNRQNQVLADVIYSHGVIKPVVISVNRSQTSEATYVAKLQDVDKNIAGEEFYLDDKMNLVKLIIRQNAILVLERSTLEDIINKFPEKADEVLGRIKILEGRSPAEKTIEDNTRETNRTL